MTAEELVRRVALAAGLRIRGAGAAARRHPVRTATVLALLFTAGAAVLVTALSVYVVVWPVLAVTRRRAARRHVCSTLPATTEETR